MPMPKPNPFASSKIKKPSPAKKSMAARAAGMGSALKKAAPGKMKTILAMLRKAGGTPRGESPMPYSRFGQPMD